MKSFINISIKFSFIKYTNPLNKFDISIFSFIPNIFDIKINSKSSYTLVNYLYYPKIKYYS